MQSQKYLSNGAVDHPNVLKSILDDYPKESWAALLQEKRKSDGHTLLHAAAEKPKTLGFIVKEFPESAILKTLEKKNKDGFTVLHFVATNPVSLRILQPLYKKLPEKKLLSILRIRKSSYNRNEGIAIDLAKKNHEALAILLELYPQQVRHIDIIKSFDYLNPKPPFIDGLIFDIRQNDDRYRRDTENIRLQNDVLALKNTLDSLNDEKRKLVASYILSDVYFGDYHKLGEFTQIALKVSLYSLSEADRIAVVSRHLRRHIEGRSDKAFFSDFLNLLPSKEEKAAVIKAQNYFSGKLLSDRETVSHIKKFLDDTEWKNVINQSFKHSNSRLRNFFESNPSPEAVKEFLPLLPASLVLKSLPYDEDKMNWTPATMLAVLECLPEKDRVKVLEKNLIFIGPNALLASELFPEPWQKRTYFTKVFSCSSQDKEYEETLCKVLALLPYKDLLAIIKKNPWWRDIGDDFYSFIKSYSHFLTVSPTILRRVLTTIKIEDRLSITRGLLKLSPEMVDIVIKLLPKESRLAFLQQFDVINNNTRIDLLLYSNDFKLIRSILNELPDQDRDALLAKSIFPSIHKQVPFEVDLVSNFLELLPNQKDKLTLIQDNIHQIANNLTQLKKLLDFFPNPEDKLRVLSQRTKDGKTVYHRANEETLPFLLELSPEEDRLAILNLKDTRGHRVCSLNEQSKYYSLLPNTLSTEDGCKKVFLSHHKALLTEQQTSFLSLFGKRTTKIQKTMNLAQILEHAQSGHNRSRDVCVRLNWLKKNGELHTQAPKVVCDLLNQSKEHGKKAL